MRSGTQNCQLVHTQIGENASVAIVDTPGFDDTTRTDAEIFTLITTFLTSQYQLGIPLKGIIYTHRITDPKMQGSALRNFQRFQKICGDHALGNVILLTTMWDKLANEVEGLDRDQELREHFWSLMEKEGSYIERFDGSKDMAEALVALLLQMDPVVLDIQEELHVQGKRLEETTAGQMLVPDIDKRLEESKEHIEYLEVRIKEADRLREMTKRENFERQQREYRERRKREEADRRRLRAQVAKETEERIRTESRGNKRKGNIQIFAQITGVAISVVMNLLPLFGVSIS